MITDCVRCERPLKDTKGMETWVGGDKPVCGECTEQLRAAGRSPLDAVTVKLCGGCKTSGHHQLNGPTCKRIQRQRFGIAFGDASR